METRFAPAEREDIEQVHKTFEAMRSHVPYDAILNLIPDISLILTAKRRVLFANAATFDSLGPEPASIPLCADPVLMRRVLLNMLKNALEASKEGEVVSISLSRSDSGIGISVHNPGFIPEEAQLQVFQRSFSTKGRGRGIGTYSMKTLTEEYLGGRISFTSSEREGTTFLVELPRLAAQA
jgi:signal transduction histidine kinase